jgi:uncharacterized protein YuzE
MKAKVRASADTGALYIFTTAEEKNLAVAKTIDIAPSAHVYVDLDANNNVMGIEIIHPLFWGVDITPQLSHKGVQLTVKEETDNGCPSA